MRHRFLTCWILVPALSGSALAQSLDPSIGFLGFGYGRRINVQRSFVAPGGVIYFYFTGVPFVNAGNIALPPGNWPDEIGGISLEFDTGNAVIQAPLGRLERSVLCASTPDIAQIPQLPTTCLLTAITAQVPWEVNTNVGINQTRFPTRITLITPRGRSQPFSISQTSAAPRLLSVSEFGLGMEESGGEDWRNIQIHTVLSRGGPCAQPGEQVTVYSYGLGRPERAVPLGDVTEEPVPVPRRIFVVFQFQPGVPVLRIKPERESPFWTLPGAVEVEPDSIELVPGKVGVYQIRLTVPPLPAGVPVLPEYHATVTVAAGGRTVFGRVFVSPDNAMDGFNICVRPPAE